MTFALDTDALWPRDAAHRYRLYGRLGDELHVLAACATAEGIGAALVQLHDDQKQIGQRLSDLGAFGVLDVLEGEWVVLPWQRTDQAATFIPTEERIRL